ncbi:MAG: hypothetical protein II359_06465 [Clostridia bacterium]|nr:hypothetical protein [Clostridia bacterium]
MKKEENRLYTLIQTHRKIGIALFWVIAIFFGCFCFPFINLTKILSDTQKQIGMINLFLCLVAYAEVGLLSGYLFEKKKTGAVLLIHAAHIIGGMLCRYFLEIGEVSNTYNFTLPNIAIHMAAISCICLCSYLHTKKQIAENKEE